MEVWLECLSARMSLIIGLDNWNILVNSRRHLPGLIKQNCEELVPCGPQSRPLPTAAVLPALLPDTDNQLPQQCLSRPPSSQSSRQILTAFQATQLPTLQLQSLDSLQTLFPLFLNSFSPLSSVYSTPFKSGLLGLMGFIVPEDIDPQSCTRIPRHQDTNTSSKNGPR